MGFRFRRSIRIAPGLRVNIGKRGISSMSLGKRGATLNVGKSVGRRFDSGGRHHFSPPSFP
jgi:hypothetical protein